MLQFEGFSAWISVDGIAKEAYNTEHPKFNSMTCWIASESGRKFSVNWFNETRDFPVQGVVSMDGVICDNHIMLDAHSYPDRPSAIGISYARTSEYTRRDFMFTTIEVTDDDAYLHTLGQTYNFGIITLELWRLQVTSVVSQTLEHQYGNPVLEDQVVHERSKKAGTHHVKYSEEYVSPAPMVDMVTGYKLDASPYVTFTFKYRPIGLLMANGIVPRPIAPANNIASRSRNADPRTLAEIQALEARLASLRSTSGVSAKTGASHASRRIKTEQEVIDLT